MSTTIDLTRPIEVREGIGLEVKHLSDSMELMASESYEIRDLLALDDEIRKEVIAYDRLFAHAPQMLSILKKLVDLAESRNPSNSLYRIEIIGSRFEEMKRLVEEIENGH